MKMFWFHWRRFIDNLQLTKSLLCGLFIWAAAWHSTQWHPHVYSLLAGEEGLRCRWNSIRSLSLKSESLSYWAGPRSCPATCGMPHILFGSPSLFDRFIFDILTQRHTLTDTHTIDKGNFCSLPFDPDSPTCAIKIWKVVYSVFPWTQFSSSLFFRFYKLQLASWHNLSLSSEFKGVKIPTNRKAFPFSASLS